MPKFLMRRIVFIPLLLALLVGLYALAGFWLAPKLIRSQATDYVRTELGKQLQLGEITTNPFTFELDIRDAAIVEEKRPLLAFKRLYVDFQASSLWKGAYTFRQVALDGPFARAIIRPDGSLNLADLVPKSEDDSPIPSVWIADLAVRAGQVNFADRSRRLKPEKTLSPITFSLRDFRTTSEGGGFVLDARSADGEGFRWQGHASLQPVASTGQFSVKGLKARSVYEFVGNELPFELNAGHIDLAGRYDFAAGTATTPLRLDATLPSIAATGLAIRAHGVGEDWLTLPAATLDNTRLSLAKRQVGIDALRIDGLQAKLWREKDGSLNIDRLLAVSEPVASDATATVALAPRPAAPARPWQLRLAKFDLKDAVVDLQDHTVTPAANFKLAPLAVTTGGLNQDMNQPVTIAVATTINGQAPLTISGDVVPATSAATLQVGLDKLPIRDLLAYLPDYPTLVLRSGTIGARGKLALAAGTMAVSFDGDASIGDFDLIEKAGSRDFVSWDRVDLEGLAYRSAPEDVSIRRVLAHKAFARVIIAPDQTLNLVTIFNAPTPASAQSGAKAAPMMPVKIGEVALDAGTMSFSDHSIDPNFQARIDALRGKINGLSTANDSVAKIDLAGQIINKYSPVAITGRTNLFAYDKHTDITMSFKNIELPIFNPYSGRFAGYAIAKGKLSTELHYRIDDRKLVADHHVLLDQLEWGAATNSKDKVSLPIRLATSLLKDRHGVIDLNLPVTGTLDDPKFRVGPIVWQIIKNIVVKIVTAPFSFLGGLFKGAEDAQYVDFAPGSAVLPDKAKTALPELAKGLVDRPALKIDIPAGTAIDADAAAIGDQHFLDAIAIVLKGKKKDQPPAYATLEDDDKIDVLKDLYKAQFGHKAEPPDAPEASEDASRKEKKAARRGAEVAWFEAQLRPRFKATDAELAALGQSRATAVQEALLAGGELDPTRVFLATQLPVTSKDGAIRMELGLK